jgi:hypothetical protein
MEIKTKYNICNTVFFIEKGKIRKDVIDDISITYSTIQRVMYENVEWDRKLKLTISYYINQEWYDEEVLYPSKEELLNSLQDETEK